jgi:hypothetical protein
MYPFPIGQGGISACPLTSIMLCSIWGRCNWLWLWCCVVDFCHVLWTITCIIYAFLCIMENCNEICVIAMYKFSGGHARKFRCFFLFQMTGFLQKSDQFSVKSVRDSVAEFWWNSAWVVTWPARSAALSMWARFGPSARNFFSIFQNSFNSIQIFSELPKFIEICRNIIKMQDIFFRILVSKYTIFYLYNISLYKIPRSQTLVKFFRNIQARKNLETLHSPLFPVQQIIQNRSTFFTEQN